MENCDALATQMFTSVGQVYVVLGAAVLPVFILMFIVPKAVDALVFATSVEMMKRKAAIAEVRREMGTKKAIRAMKLLRMMKASAKSRKGKDPEAGKSTIASLPADKVEKMRAEVCARRPRHPSALHTPSRCSIFPVLLPSFTHFPQVAAC